MDEIRPLEIKSRFFKNPWISLAKEGITQEALSIVTLGPQSDGTAY